MRESSVDQIRADYRRGLLTYSAALDALNRLQVANAGVLLTHPIHVARSTLLATRRPM